MDPLERVRASLREQLAQRATHESTITTIQRSLTGDAQLSAEQSTQVDAATDAIRGIDTEIVSLRARETELVDQARRDEAAAQLRRELGVGDQPEHRGPAHVTREERTYTRDKNERGQGSFFADAYRYQMRGDQGALERLQRLATEMEREGERRLFSRAIATGGFGSLVVPQYLPEMYALAIRSGRPLANLCTRQQIPAQGMTLTLPRGTTGAAVSAQATENTAVQNTDEAWTDLQIPVRTIAGQADISRQSLERGEPGIDNIVFMDLTGAYHAEVDRQVAIGSGASGQMLGMLATAGISSATAFGAALGAGNFNLKLAGLVGAVTGAGRGIVPRAIVMHTRRWAWLTGLTDNTGRPLVNVGAPTAFNPLGLMAEPGAYSGDSGAAPVVSVGTLQGIPTFTDVNMPTAQGTLSEDNVAAFDPYQCFLWEDGNGDPRQLRFDQTLSNQLTIKLEVYSYVAFSAARYPVAVAKMGGLDTGAGNGLVMPTF